MKNILTFSKTAFLALALGTACSSAVLAQTTSTTTTTPPAPDSPAPVDKKMAKHEAVLTADEKAHLDQVRAEAYAADPTLKAEAASIQAQHRALKEQGANSAPDAKQALKTLAKEHDEKMKVAMLKIDPTVAPILAKLKAAHKEKKDAPAAA